ncbi:MAG: NADH:ubiquinone oxidoreductase subunit F (NADH-binding)/NADH:ubiquinone oxidoreductase subunit E [Flavobacteriales bacterium]
MYCILPSKSDKKRTFQSVNTVIIMSDNLSELSGRKGLKYNLFDEMGKRAQDSGTIPTDDLDKLAKEFLIGKANTYGTATFYDFLKPENKGKKAYVCNGSACLCAGTQDEVQKNLEKHFKAEEIGHMCCLGRCHENAAFHIDGTNYSGKDISDLDSVLDKDTLAKSDTYHIGSLGKAVLTKPFSGMEAHYSKLRTWIEKGRQTVLDEIKESGIRGRGGAGFPMGFKLESCMNEPGDTKFIVCNADEGDPGAYSDRYLMEEQPHSVLFGMLLAGYVIGAKTGILYIRAEYPDSVRIVAEAIEDLNKHGFLGESVAGTHFSFDFKIIKAQGAYICGEETALLSSIEGQRPEVRVRPPYPTQQGLFNKPTVVNNVETLAALHFILNEGGNEYKKLGTDKSSGTKLISLDSYFNRPGMYEVEMGTPLSTVIDELGQGFKEPVKALHIGGPLGGLVPVDKCAGLNIDFESFAQGGFLLGHASIVSIPASFPIVAYLEHLFEFAAYESCGKCFPCRLGTQRGFEMFQKARTEGYKIDRKLLSDLLDTLQQGSLCAHGGGIPLPVKNAVQYFDDELNEYFA